MSGRSLCAGAVCATAVFTAYVDAPLAAPVRCPVSATAPIPGRTAFNVGTTRLAVALPKDATFVAVRDGRPGWAWVQQDGWIRTKLGWLSPGRVPKVEGRRLDGRSRPLRVDMGVSSFAETGRFYPSLLYFRSAGCWKLTASNGSASLDVVVRVVER